MHPILAGYDALLVDLDGTVFEGSRPIEGAAEGLAHHRQKHQVMYVTNNASRTPAQVAAHLTSLGFDTAAEHVLTSAMAGAKLAYVRTQELHPGEEQLRVFVIGGEALREACANEGFTVVNSADEHPHVVVHGHSPDNRWETMSEGALAIQRGALYIATNLDTTLPTERGLMLGNGSMVAAVSSATGVVPEAAGKPGPAMFHQAQEVLGSFQPLAVGDRLNTDIAGGNAAGFDTLFTATGVSGHWDVLRAPAAHRPTHVAANLRDHLPGWSASAESSVDGKHRIVVSAGTTQLHHLTEGTEPQAEEIDATSVMAAEALAVAMPLYWAYVDSGVAPGDIVIEGNDTFAKTAIGAWR